MPSNKNTSPILLTINALVAALAAWALVYQKLMSKYEQTPTPSQPKNSTTKLSAETRMSINKVKSVK
jgi:hypothetical protein